MPGIPRRDPLPDSLYPSQILGARVAEIRGAKRLSQQEIADRLEVLGHPSWHRQTVSQVERAERNVTVDELVSLALALEVAVVTLFSPRRLVPFSGTESDVMVDIGTSELVDVDSFMSLVGFPTARRPWSVADWDDPDRARLVVGTPPAGQPEEETTE